MELPLSLRRQLLRTDRLKCLKNSAGNDHKSASTETVRASLGDLLIVSRCRHGSPRSGRGSRCAGKADHLAQQIGVRGLLYERAQVHHVVGHRWFLGCVGVSQPDPTGELPVTTAKPPARYGAIGGARPGGFALPSYTTSGDTTLRRYSRKIGRSKTATEFLAKYPMLQA